jgi:hypothetical protein
MSHTRDAVCGRISAAKPYGSALSTLYPLKRDFMWYLYNVPDSISATKALHTPTSEETSGFASGFQSLNGPTTDTRSAFGAQTANRAPRRPANSVRCAPSFS